MISVSKEEKLNSISLLCLWNPFHKPCQDIMLYFPIPYTFRDTSKKPILSRSYFWEKNIIGFSNGSSYPPWRESMWTAILDDKAKIGALSILVVSFMKTWGNICCLKLNNIKSWTSLIDLQTKCFFQLLYSISMTC